MTAVASPLTPFRTMSLTLYFSASASKFIQYRPAVIVTKMSSAEMFAEAVARKIRSVREQILLVSCDVVEPR